MKSAVYGPSDVCLSASLESSGKYSTVGRLALVSTKKDWLLLLMVGTARFDMSKGFILLDMTMGMESLQYSDPSSMVVVAEISLSVLFNGNNESPPQGCSTGEGSNSDVAFGSHYTYIRVQSLLCSGSLRGTESIGKSPSSGACRSCVRCRQGREVPAMNCSHKSRISLELRRVCS